MSMMNTHEQAVFQAGLRSIKTRLGRPHSQLPHGSTLTALMKHGGLYTLLDTDLMTARVAPLTDGLSSTQAQSTVQEMESMAQNFFYKLSPLPGYTLNPDLISFITFPNGGVAYENTPHPNLDIPAVFTFVGQFIDHDLTMNAVDLTIDEQGTVVPDNASPTIDLDSVYGPRTTLNNTLPSAGGADNYDIFNSDGTFKLNGNDLPRFQSDGLSPAYIIDARNDENQIILQIHILIMRVHNALVAKMSGALGDLSREDLIAAVRKEVVLNWQSVIRYDYMPRIIDADTLSYVLEQIHKRDYGELKHKPYRDLVNHRNVVRMPHEFAIGFRFGHSQLRPEYQLNSGPAILLFNNRMVGLQDDLRGSRPLANSHVIDWSVFYPQTPSEEHSSLKIDGLVTPPVFDLPATTIPDDIKYIGNLIQRNLIRGEMIGVVSGEEFAKFYGIEPLDPSQVVDFNTYPQAEALFSQDGPFKTPLWYYIVKEAEVKASGKMLGPLVPLYSDSGVFWQENGITGRARGQAAG